MERGVSTPLEQIGRGDWRGEPGEMRVVPLGRAATVADLLRTDLKAEIVGGQLVVIGPSACLPAQAGGSIVLSLAEHARRTGGGVALGGRVAFLVDLPHRLAFCPDASWYTGPECDGDFPRGAPVFAVEVRDAGDYGRDAELRLAAKRADYFAAGTLVVWDVDVLREEVVRVFRASSPEEPTVVRRGETADAEPAVPGWRMPVDELFE